MADEARVRNKVIKYAKERGVEHIRLSFRRGVAAGWPDDLFLIPGGRPLFIEFKAPGKTPTALQIHRISTLEALGYDVRCADNVEAACSAIASALAVGSDEGAARGHRALRVV